MKRLVMLTLILVACGGKKQPPPLEGNWHKIARISHDTLFDDRGNYCAVNADGDSLLKASFVRVGNSTADSVCVWKH